MQILSPVALLEANRICICELSVHLVCVFTQMLFACKCNYTCKVQTKMDQAGLEPLKKIHP